MKPVFKYALIMPHMERAEQLDRTLASCAHQYRGRSDYIVVVVEDPKNTDSVGNVLSVYDGVVPFLHLRLKWDGPCWTPCPHYNQGVASVDAEYVLPTNPECLHAVDILTGLDEEFNRDPNVYVVCACEAGARVDMPDGVPSLTYQHQEWYQHSVHGPRHSIDAGRSRDLNFCTAISRVNYARVGGFDEEYIFGLGFADNAFRDAVEGAGIPFVRRDDLLSLHQEHTQIPRRGSGRAKLVNRNRMLYAKQVRQ